MEVWLHLLFLPLVPLSRWRVTAAPRGSGQAEEETVELTVHSRSRVPAAAALRRIARAAVAAALLLLPLALGVRSTGTPWATSLLTPWLGRVLSSGLLGKLGMAMELGVVLAGAAAPILVLMLLDDHTPRVSLRLALGLAPRPARGGEATKQ